MPESGVWGREADLKEVAYSADNLVVETKLKRGEYAMSNATQESILSPSTVGMGLEDIIRQGARAIIQQAIEAELADLLASFRHVTTMDGRQTVVRNGYLPEREVMTTIGPVPVKVPKVRDRSGNGIKFNSALVPPYVRKSKRGSAASPPTPKMSSGVLMPCGIALNPCGLRSQP